MITALHSMIPAFKAAVIALVYTQILITEGHIMHGFHQLLTRIFSRKKTYVQTTEVPPEVLEMGYEPEYKTVTKYEKMGILKPLGDCELCMAGQMMLWVYVVKLFFPDNIKTVLALVWNGVFLICLAILVVFTLKKLYDKCQISKP